MLLIKSNQHRWLSVIINYAFQVFFRTICNVIATFLISQESRSGQTISSIAHRFNPSIFDLIMFLTNLKICVWEFKLNKNYWLYYLEKCYWNIFIIACPNQYHTKVLQSIYFIGSIIELDLRSIEIVFLLKSYNSYCFVIML